MRRILPFLCLFAIAQPVSAQGIFEGHAVRVGAAGVGAGLAAGANHGRLLRRSYESMVEAQRVATIQTKAITDYTAQAVQFEAKKQFANAEMAYQYVLQVIARRDGPGSEKAVPVLEKLVKVAKAQQKTDDAIRYQKTVVAFMESKKPSEVSTLKAQNELTSLFMVKDDFSGAEPVAARSAAIVQQNSQVAPAQRTATLRVYARILHKLNKEDKAKAVEAEIAQDEAPTVPAAPVAEAAAPTAVVPTAPVAPPAVPALSGTPAAAETPAAPVAPEAPAAPAATETPVAPATPETPAAPAATDTAPVGAREAERSAPAGEVSPQVSPAPADAPVVPPAETNDSK